MRASSWGSELNLLEAEAKKSLLCAVCGAPPVGMIHIDAWGNRTCAKHAHELKRCNACQRMICQRLTGGGLKHPDGRYVCNLCRQTAIDSKEQAKPYVEACAAWLYDRGFRFENLALKIELVEAHVLNPGYTGANGLIQGQIMKVWQSFGQRFVKGVKVLNGLPSQLMQGVFIHELGHAWLFLEGIDSLPLEVEEGFCEVLAYLFHRETDTEESRVYMQMIEKNPSPVYGEGFRKMRDAIRKHKFEVVLHHLQIHKSLPL